MAERIKKFQGGSERRKASPIVAIGASAGGIPALKQFFEAMPENPGIAFVVVLHLSPSHESHLVSVLQRTTKLEVVPVERSARIKPDCIYVISPNTVLTITDDRLRAREPESQMERRHPVDAIFQSLAEHRGADAIGVILSGSGSNGSAGAQSIREHDGIILVQDPESAEHPEMPRNVVMAGLADRVLPPQDMPTVLVGYVRGTNVTLEKTEDEIAQTSETELNSILAVLRTRGHHDFSPYKKKTLVRRILRRMGLTQIEGFRHYVDKLRSDPEEIQALIGDLLINVTGFFRDPEAWETMDEKVIAPIIESRSDGQPVRVWVPACSTGEESYSIAMMLLERAEEVQKPLDIKVFATDAAPQALARARAGLFPATIAEAIPAARLNRFFDKEDDLYRAKKSLREAVIFAPQNLLSDPPFSRLDLVSCRNLLIYLEPQVQDKIIALLHFALREGGYLFLGTAETVGRHTDLFHPLSKKWRIYRRTGTTRHELVDFPLLGSDHAGPGEAGGARGARRAPADEARDTLLSAFAPPSVLIDEHHRILYFHGDLEPYLKTPSGEPTLDLLAMTREEFRPKLRASIRQALKEKNAVTADVGLKKNRKSDVRLTASPIFWRASAARLLVSFEERATNPRASHERRELERQAFSEGQLEEELRTAREELRLSVEQLETSNEELKASNEEITSMNEELQSTNEELETSKEELQSLNEELNTVNTQLQSKVEELEDRTNDLDNLLNSTAIATLFLDDQCRIRWFSPPVRTLFQIIQADVGRPITDFAQRFNDETFLDDARDVLRNLQPREKEVSGADERWNLRRILPYRTEDNRIDGVVATFTDITERKQWEEALGAAKVYAESIVDTTRQPLVVLTENMIVRSANRAFYECFRLTPQQTESRVLFEVNGGDWDIPDLRRALRDAIPDSGILTDLEVTHVFRELGRRHLLVNARKLDDAALRLVAIEDVTARKQAEAHREVLLSELHHRVKNLLTKVLAIITLSQGKTESVEDYASDLKLRIAAIGRTEELIGGRIGDIPLREVLETELASVKGNKSIKIDGPDIRLSSNEAQTFALALHELATNAVKYGALANEDAELRIGWTVGRENGRGVVSFQWTESGVAVEGTPRRGFGSRLIREVVPRMLEGSVNWDVTPEGVRCVITMPLAASGPGRA